MNVALTQDEIAFVESSRRMLAQVCTPEIVQGASTPQGSGHSSEVWKALAQAGWMGILFPGAYDGGDGSLFDLGLAFREAGRALVPTTLHSTILAGLYLNSLGTTAQKDRWLLPLCRGEVIATVAVSEHGVFENLGLIASTARRDGDGWILNGTKVFVANAGLAHAVLVLASIESADDPAGFGMFLVPGGTAGMETDPYLTFGQDALFEVNFDKCKLPDEGLVGKMVGGQEWQEICEAPMQRARALQCMEMLGGIEAVIDRTVTYVSERHQFGVPIGTFQAVQHQLANLAMRLEAGRTAAFRALWSVSQLENPEHELSIAEIWLSRTYVDATLTAHQVWGGMGYAIEGQLYLWSQRAKTLDLLVGRKSSKLENLLVSACERNRG